MITSRVNGVIGSGPTISATGDAPRMSCHTRSTIPRAARADTSIKTMYAVAKINAPRTGVEACRRRVSQMPTPSISHNQGSTMNMASP